MKLMDRKNGIAISETASLRLGTAKSSIGKFREKNSANSFL